MKVKHSPTSPNKPLAVALVCLGYLFHHYGGPGSWGLIPQSAHPSEIGNEIIAAILLVAGMILHGIDLNNIGEEDKETDEEKTDKIEK
jgi:hypothetical protein